MTKVRHVTETFYRFLGPKHRCAYCGEPSDTIDHTTPRWFVEGNDALLRRYWVFKVSACGSCNNLAGALIDRTFYGRKQRIARKLARRARRLLQTAHWPKEDLEEMGFMLRHLCEQADKDAEVVRRRLTFLADISWPHGIPVDLQILHQTDSFLDPWDEEIDADGNLMEGAEAYHRNPGSFLGHRDDDGLVLREWPLQKPTRRSRAP
jgi:hypothetical protein